MEASDTDRLREDIAEVLRHQFETARHQQDVRDRWYQYYLVSAGAILSLSGALLTAAFRTDWSTSKLLSETISERDYLTYTIPVLVSVSMGLMLGLGVLFLGIYLTQIVSYQLNYRAIARAYECYLLLHSPEIARHGIPNPFVFTYGRRRSTASNGGKRRWYGFPAVVIRQVCDPQLWAADFWSNCVPIFLNSVCFAVILILWFRPFMARHWLCVLIGIFLAQITLRHLLLIGITTAAVTNFEQRWPESDVKKVAAGND